jgi:hypothetical protein
VFPIAWSLKLGSVGRGFTLTSVHDAILDDLTFPAEIVGKRIRIKLDGSRLIKVHQIHTTNSQQSN